MTMRALLLDADAQRKAQAVVDYASAHVYDLANDNTIPGNNPAFVCQLNTFRCVFTFTREKEQPRRLYRHLTISVPSEHYPNPIAVAAIAGLFHFSGADKGLVDRLSSGAWMANVNKEEHCVVVVEITSEEHVR